MRQLHQKISLALDSHNEALRLYKTAPDNANKTRRWGAAKKNTYKLDSERADTGLIIIEQKIKLNLQGALPKIAPGLRRQSVSYDEMPGFNRCHDAICRSVYS